jgi:tetratricopeptide (TPR) repeat protein
MAIEKIEGTPQSEWTLSALIQIGVSVVLVLVALLLGWLAFSNWRFKSNLVEGYQEYDRGRPKTAVIALETALSWRKEHTGARELLAKILCDEGKLSEARKHYQILAAQGYRAPQVFVGLGVLALKEVEALEKPKEIEAMVSEAASEFRKVGGVPEAEIGLGHCELVLARKLGNPGYYPRAQAVFAKVRNAMEQSREFRAQITRDGLVDYYTGLGKALASGEKYEEGARDAFAACYQYTPSWGLPMSNVLALEARRFAQMTETNENMLKMQADINLLRNQARIIFNSLKGEDREDMREPWLMFSLGLAQAWGRAGNVNELSAIVKDLTSGGFDQRMEPYILEAMIRTELALKDEANPSAQEQAVTKATAGYNELLNRLPNDDANKERRAIAANNAGWTLAWRGGFSSSESLYQQAHAKLNDALRLYPDDYVFNRNMAIVMKRMRKPPAAPTGFLEKCRAAAAKDKELAEDFERVQKYIETK